MVSRNDGINDDLLIKEILDEFLSKLRESLEYKTLGIYLFGSVAKGTATPESDIDVLIVYDNVDERELLELKGHELEAWKGLGLEIPLHRCNLHPPIYPLKKRVKIQRHSTEFFYNPLVICYFALLRLYILTKGMYIENEEQICINQKKCHPQI